jgi:hypothetical protein
VSNQGTETQSPQDLKETHAQEDQEFLDILQELQLLNQETEYIDSLFVTLRGSDESDLPEKN